MERKRRSVRLSAPNAAFATWDFPNGPADQRSLVTILAMRRGRWADDPEALRRSARDGVIATAALRGLGVPGPTIARRCQDGGRGAGCSPASSCSAADRPPGDSEITAALMYGGPDALVTGLEACRGTGSAAGPSRRARSTCSCPRSGSSRASEFVVVERTTRLPAGDSCATAFRWPPLPRACLDACPAPALRRRDHRADRGHRQRRLCTPAQLAAELREGSQRGSATPRRVLADVSEGVRSTAERDAKRLLARSGLPEPWWNVRGSRRNGAGCSGSRTPGSTRSRWPGRSTPTPGTCCRSTTLGRSRAPRT